jgi:hypothetical protein
MEPLLTQIKLATDYQVNKRILREKIQTDLHRTPYCCHAKTTGGYGALFR